jgi:hypothetical protein
VLFRRQEQSVALEFHGIMIEVALFEFQRDHRLGQLQWFSCLAFDSERAEKENG